MKILVVGLGSMGRRRVRNLKYLGVKDIIGFDLREERCREAREKYGIETFASFETALAQNPGSLVISTPPNMHHKYALIAAEKGKNFFTESNFLPEGMDDLVRIEKRKDIVAVPSFTLPHHPSIKQLQGLLAKGSIGQPLFFTYHLSSYLPGWHPWEDYRQVYYSHPETPGCREMVAFELTWLVWLFGKVKKVAAAKGKLSDLETPIDDIYQVILEFENGLRACFLAEIISGHHNRNFQLYGSEGTITWDFSEGLLRLVRPKTKEKRDFPESAGISEPGYSLNTHEEMYIEEMEDFLKAVKKEKRYPYSFSREKIIVDLLQNIGQKADKW